MEVKEKKVELIELFYDLICDLIYVYAASKLTLPGKRKGAEAR